MMQGKTGPYMSGPTKNPITGKEEQFASLGVHLDNQTTTVSVEFVEGFDQKSYNLIKGSSPNCFRGQVSLSQRNVDGRQVVDMTFLEGHLEGRTATGLLNGVYASPDYSNSKIGRNYSTLDKIDLFNPRTGEGITQSQLFQKYGPLFQDIGGLKE